MMTKTTYYLHYRSKNNYTDRLYTPDNLGFLFHTYYCKTISTFKREQ